MKVIFLDHDGVICLSQQWGGRHKKWNKFKKEFDHKILSEIPIEYRFDNFDKKSIKVLNEILEETDVEIVISSDWKKHATLEELGEYYEIQGIIKKPIDFTEKFHYTNWEKEGFFPEGFPWRRDLWLEQERFFEIKRFLKDHPEITNWVAVDDLNMGTSSFDWRGHKTDRKWGLENFVHTPKATEGIKQTGIKEKILKFL